MTDISKCNNDNCSLRDKCWRWLAPASNWQSYMDYKPDENGVCDDFWERKKEKESK